MNNHEAKKLQLLWELAQKLIKLAPVIKALEESNFFQTYAISTGQHKEILTASC
jgi:hypothetical protein